MYSEEYCEDCMSYDVLYEKNNLKLYQLTNDDEKLLLEYAPKLFNVYNGKNLKEVMIDTAILIHNYRNSFLAQKVNKIFSNNYPLVMKNKTENERQESFKKQVENIINLLGGDVLGTKKGNQLKEQLRDALHNTEDYFVSKPDLIESKKVIENYLAGLKLEGKSLIIKDFIKSIK